GACAGRVVRRSRMSLFDALWKAGALRPLDHAFAQSLRRLDGDDATPAPVLAGAALASLAVSHGHAGFDPARPRLLLGNEALAAVDWPSTDEWNAALAGSRWISRPGDGDDAPATAPLVFESGLLYLRRYRQYEHRLAQRLRRLAAQAPATVERAALAPLIAALFPASATGTTPGADGQACAAVVALERSLLLVTGGPG